MFFLLCVCFCWRKIDVDVGCMRKIQCDYDLKNFFDLQLLNKINTYFKCCCTRSNVLAVLQLLILHTSLHHWVFRSLWVWSWQALEFNCCRQLEIVLITDYSSFIQIVRHLLPIFWLCERIVHFITVFGQSNPFYLHKSAIKLSYPFLLLKS